MELTSWNSTAMVKSEVATMEESRIERKRPRATLDIGIRVSDGGGGYKGRERKWGGGTGDGPDD
jgi:hypothetical protein